jgi:hypothetical protein
MLPRLQNAAMMSLIKSWRKQPVRPSSVALAFRLAGEDTELCRALVSQIYASDPREHYPIAQDYKEFEAIPGCLKTRANLLAERDGRTLVAPSVSHGYGDLMFAEAGGWWTTTVLAPDYD